MICTINAIEESSALEIYYCYCIFTSKSENELYKALSYYDFLSDEKNNS
jgi:hypothetical protein